MSDKKNVFTIYRIRDGINYQGVYNLKPSNMPAFDSTIKIGSLDCRFIVSNSFGRIPDWLKEMCRISGEKISKHVESAGGVLEIKINDTIYCVTFGAKGRFLIASTAIEERFGLLTALNMIGENPIRQIDKTTFDSNQKHSKEQLSKEGSAREFGINVSQDILKGVTGKPTREKEFQRVSGSDGLNIRTKFDYSELDKLIEIIDAESKTGKYKDRYAWIDKFAAIKDDAIIANLDNTLDDWLKGIGSGVSLGWFSIPQAIEWDRVDGFYFSGSDSRKDLFYDIDLQFIKEAWNVNELGVSQLKKRMAQAVSFDGHVIQEYSWILYRCIYFETKINDEQYLLSDGKWFRIDAEYSSELNSYYAFAKWLNLGLKKYNHGSETLYNSSLKGTDNLVVFDKKLAYVKGEDPIEFCDAYDLKEKRLIHLKRYGQSAVLSHLFAQGYVSAELFQRNPDFRKVVLENESAKGYDLGFSSNVRPNPTEYSVVYAIISNSKDERPNIPYFSKISFRNYFQRLDGMGYQVYLSKVECEDGVVLKKKRVKKPKLKKK
ncbi:MAG: TIGR04141 family sporadically distributed protein [Fibrobacterota bacterium]|nr:TIGR04141 family sporadically distributed protein [Fibrobacterota bacterium]QQS03893.1 MAG: TIGR04141 family sporadically distributed protein [Fibrobacterota bacterium]